MRTDGEGEGAGAPFCFLLCLCVRRIPKPRPALMRGQARPHGNQSLEGEPLERDDVSFSRPSTSGGIKLYGREGEGRSLFARPPRHGREGPPNEPTPTRAGALSIYSTSFFVLLSAPRFTGWLALLYLPSRSYTCPRACHPGQKRYSSPVGWLAGF